MKVKCKCHHLDQDKLHGPQIRVANPTVKTTNDKLVVRCTVCKTPHEVKK